MALITDDESFRELDASVRELRAITAARTYSPWAGVGWAWEAVAIVVLGLGFVAAMTQCSRCEIERARAAREGLNITTLGASDAEK